MAGGWQARWILPYREGEPVTGDVLRLAGEALARAENATPGPWITRGVSVRYGGDGVTSISQPLANVYDREADAEFIAHAREDLPVLARAVQTLVAELGAAWQEKEHPFDASEMAAVRAENEALTDRLDARVDDDNAFRVYDELHARAIAAERANEATQEALIASHAERHGRMFSACDEDACPAARAALLVAGGQDNQPQYAYPSDTQGRRDDGTCFVRCGCGHESEGSYFGRADSGQPRDAWFAHREHMDAACPERRTAR